MPGATTSVLSENADCGCGFVRNSIVWVLPGCKLTLKEKYMLCKAKFTMNNASSHTSAEVLEYAGIPPVPPEPNVTSLIQYIR